MQPGATLELAEENQSLDIFSDIRKTEVMTVGTGDDASVHLDSPKALGLSHTITVSIISTRYSLYRET